MSWSKFTFKYQQEKKKDKRILTVVASERWVYIWKFILLL